MGDLASGRRARARTAALPGSGGAAEGDVHTTANGAKNQRRPARTGCAPTDVATAKSPRAPPDHPPAQQRRRPSLARLRSAVPPELTTRDVAELLHVTPATVRRWVARGHLMPIRQEGPANVFDSGDVHAAFENISARRRATGQPSGEGWPTVVRKPAERIPTKHYDALVTSTEAAQLLEINASTIRSWIHRGYLKPAVTTGPVLIRLGDAVVAARGRRVPQPKAARRIRR